MRDINKFIKDQLSRWPLACENFRALKGVQTREMRIGGLMVKLQFNPARIISSAAKTDKASLDKRPCFLCTENRPAEQFCLHFDGRKDKKYDILVNPYPIFNDHLCIPIRNHTEQSIWRRFVDLMDLSRAFPRFIFFYNGPKCGASAPDHHHFQGAGRGTMPLENDVDKLLNEIKGVELRGKYFVNEDGFSTSLTHVTSLQDADLFKYSGFTNGIFVLRGATVNSPAKLLYRLLDCAPLIEGDSEPRFNLFTFYSGGEYRAIVIFRTSHRSHHYFSDGPDHLTMSPGCADMGGLFIVPVPEDYEKLTPELLGAMLSEITLSAEDEALIINRLTRTQRKISVGIMSAAEIEFEVYSDGAGPRKAVYKDGMIGYDGALYDELYFEESTLSSMFAEPTFELHGVTIGKKFHWERLENQKFAGSLKIIVEDGALTAVNVVGIEDYLLSVISSEMKSSASLEFLKAHAVISRSWVLAQINSTNEPREGKGVFSQKVSPPTDHFRESSNGPIGPSNPLIPLLGGISVASFQRKYPLPSRLPKEEHIIWYDHSSHKNYDVCADDHCQRYQGLSRAIGAKVRAAIDATWGEVLTHEGTICDARFSKCCGGVLERYSTCWEPIDYPYLVSKRDAIGRQGDEETGRQGPQGQSAQDFCDTQDETVLAQVLNEYDLETKDFYKWSVEYGRDEISKLINDKSGYNFGRIVAIEPLERGESRRIWKLLIRGEQGSLVVGKELEIRRILSPSHLKSSAFDVVYIDEKGAECSESGDWKAIRLDGRGWGHGVGRCQIGAAVMSSQGYDYRSILAHYYPNSELTELK